MAFARDAAIGSEGPYRRYEHRRHWSSPGTWSRQRVVDAIRDWAEQFGEPPLCYHWSPWHAGAARASLGLAREWRRQYPRWPSLSTVSRYFGSWSLGLEAAGFNTRQTAIGSELVERVETARRLAKAGRTKREIAALLGVAPRTVRGYLHAGICAACGGPVITARLCRACAWRRRPEWTAEAVVAAIAAWNREESRLPRAHDWLPGSEHERKWAREYPRWPSSITVRTIFGSWNAGIEAAGFSPTRRYWQPQSIIAALKDFGEEEGRPPSQQDLARVAGLPTAQTLRNHFGSVSTAWHEAGFQVRRRRWSRASIIGAMTSFQRKHGRLPTEQDWQRSSIDHPHATTVRQQFGSWSAALRRLDGELVSPPSRCAA